MWSSNAEDLEMDLIWKELFRYFDDTIRCLTEFSDAISYLVFPSALFFLTWIEWKLTGVFTTWFWGTMKHSGVYFLRYHSTVTV